MRGILAAAAVTIMVSNAVIAQSGAPVYDIGKDVSAPVLVKEVKPTYPPDVRAEGVNGLVEMQGVVETTGAIDHIIVTRSIDERLDREAVKALSQWEFKPGRKDGEAVAVRVNVEMTFTVK